MHLPTHLSLLVSLHIIISAILTCVSFGRRALVYVNAEDSCNKMLLESLLRLDVWCSSSQTAEPPRVQRLLSGRRPSSQGRCLTRASPLWQPQRAAQACLLQGQHGEALHRSAEGGMASQYHGRPPLGSPVPRLGLGRCPDCPCRASLWLRTGPGRASSHLCSSRPAASNT